MLDREKVIKGLKNCKTLINCKECPYAHDERAFDGCCEEVLHNDVLELLEVQMQMIQDLQKAITILRRAIKEIEDKKT